MKVTGKILEVHDTQQVTDTFKKRTLILEYVDNPQYPEYISFECIQDRCSLLDGFQPGQDVEVSFNLKGRKWVSPAGEAKYFNTLQAWRIDPVSAAQSQQPAAPQQAQPQSQDQPQPQAQPAPEPAAAASQEDDLPF